MTTFLWIILGVGVVVGVIILCYVSRDTRDEHQKRWDAGYLHRKTFGHEPDPYEDDP